MDKLTRCRIALHEELKKQCTLAYSDMPEMRYKLVQDGQSFLVLAVGWHEDEFIHDLWFHAELRADKIWFYENNTDYQIDKALEERGVAKEDIVVGWLLPDRNLLADTIAA